MNSIKTYTELCLLPDFESRLEYLSLHGSVGDYTFADKRYLNQRLYSSSQWRRIKNRIILRDEGYDLSCPDHPINGPIYIHHINPISIDDILEMNDNVFNPNNLICTSFNTHQMIHYSKSNNQPKIVLSRSKNDTCPWK